MAEGTPSIVVVDDASEVRLLIRTRLRLSGSFRVVGEGADGRDAVALAREHRPTVMLLDVSMPGTDGLEALPQVLRESPATRVVLFSGFEEQGLADRAQELGAAAFIEKSMPVETLIERLAAIASAPAERPTTPETGQTGGAPVPGPREELAGDQSVLDEHLERFREVFEEAAIGMATMTLTGRIVRANRALANLVQRPAPGLVGVFYGDLTDDRAAEVTEALGHVRADPADVLQLEHGVAGTNGQRWVKAALAPVCDSSGRPLYLFLQVQDVTAERAASEELRRSEERFRLLVEAVEDYAIFMLDPGGHVVSWNSGAQRSKGYTAAEIIGQHFRVFYPPEVAQRGHPEYELEVALRVGHYEEEGWRLRKDGSRFWANVLITAVFNEAGEHVGFAKVTRDTSDRRRLELEREQAVEALATANAELESLNARLQIAADDQSQFLAVTAHELRTPIGVLGGSAEMLSRHWSELTEQESKELFESMASSTVRLRRLLGDLLTASRLQTSRLEIHPEPVEVADIVGDAVANIRRTVTGVQVTVDVPAGLMVSADRDRLAQAVDNLLSNALRHGRPPARVHARVREDHVEIRITDEGPGVSEAVRPRLFERFATGRNKGGTGLGLFIVRELARAHGGEAYYDADASEAASGAFVIRLPLVGTVGTRLRP
jgi:PAS domain S-box-containing protein